MYKLSAYGGPEWLSGDVCQRFEALLFRMFDKELFLVLCSLEVTKYC